MKHLSSQDREFFSGISKSAFLNPFSEERHTSDASALGKKDKGEFFAFLDELLATLNIRLKANLDTGTTLYSDYEKEDSHLLKIAVLFQILHRYRDELDRYIDAQAKKPDSTINASCAATIYSELCSYGIAPNDAENYVAVIFQLRRAYYVIAKALVGHSASIRKVRIDLWNTVFTCNTELYFARFWNKLEDFSTLLLGETGTGKGAAALAIGRSCFIPYDSSKKAFSENFIDAFTEINLSEFSENLIESELFGHKKGSFTGAINDHEGVFSKCSKHGAIFLDEIGDISEQIQIKLLRVLQNRHYLPVGGKQPLRFGGRIIAATNQELTEKRRTGAFRNDFYYRLSSSHIELPTLRQRLSEDSAELELLLGKIVTRLIGTGDIELVTKISESMHKCLPESYPWPGNVRELEQAVRSIILTGAYIGERDCISTADINDQATIDCLNGRLSLTELEAWYCRRLYDKLGSYGAVATRIGVDWRTVKQKVESKA